MKIFRGEFCDGTTQFFTKQGDRHVTLDGDFEVGFSEESPIEAPIRLQAPISPPNIFAIGLNYVDHAAEGGRNVPSEPLIFAKPTTSIIGPDDVIELPPTAPDEVDFEAELVVVIGKTARRVDVQRAMDHVFGYTCGNDISARDCQKRRDKQWTRAKGFDTFCPLGPCIVTADSLDWDKAAIQSHLNGHMMQNDVCGRMVFSVPFLVSFLSCQFTLLPGTIILTGTPSGVGFARDPAVFLRHGDTIRITIEGIGELTNRVSSANL